MNYVTDGDLKKVLRGIGKKTPRGIMLGDTTVGYVTWQMTLKNDYLELDGSDIADASTDYPELLSYAIENNLVTSDPQQTLKFQYHSVTDKLTLPDFSSLDLDAGLIPQIRFKKASSVWDLLEWWGLYRNKAYAIGDIAYSKNLPSYIRLECVAAGITATSEIAFHSPVQIGQYVTDGTAVFLLTDIRDGAQVGDIKLSPVLRDGYVKANGALLTSARTNYPRLVTFITDNPSLKATDDTAWNSNKALYVYDSSADTLRVPDATGRVFQGGADVESVDAGLPNITGNIGDDNRLFGQANSTSTGSGAISTSNIDITGSGITLGSAASWGGHSNRVEFIKFNASSSDSIYGNSTTVQPPALSLIPQIKY